MWHSGPGWGAMGGWGFGLGGPILQLLVIALVIAAVVWFFRTAARSDGARSGGLDARGLDVLDERYARGEISRDEYLQKRRDLQGGA